MYVQKNPAMLDDPDGEHPVIVIVVSIGGRYVIKKVAKTAVKKVSKSTLKKAKGKLYVNRNAYKVNNKVAKNKGKPLKGYKGGTFVNRKNQLPTNARYTEHDIYPLSKSWGKGKKRGKQRIVRGSDGKVYYTKNHYKTFIRIK
ncbi:ribonuclease domain-containing protein [Pseudobacillus badius]|uniref:ribonuclease domain-containing protein n=1 Tax=Bacillus badius TaxID=1455 RepID=UPI003CF17681